MTILSFRVLCVIPVQCLFDQDMEVSRLERTQIFQLGKEIARFFVYYCEGEQYVSLIEQFREARSRRMLIDVVHSFIYYGEVITVQAKQLQVTSAKWQTLCQFFRHGKIEEARRLHASMITSIAMLEMEKIRSTQQYLAKLLSGLD